MATIGSLIVEMALSQAKFQADLGKAAQEAKNAADRITRSLEAQRKASEAASEKIKEYGLHLLRAAGAAIGLEAIRSALEAIKEKTIEGERAFSLLTNTLRATDSAAGLTLAKLEKLNREIQEKTVFDDDGIRQAQAALLRFRTIQGDTFKEALRLVPDLATALGSDLPAAAQTLGKALTDPEHGMKSLRDVGIFLSESQKDLARHFIETGDAASAARVVLDELRKTIGGSAEADAAGLYGGSKRLGRAFDDLQKSIGKKIFTDTTSIDLGTQALTHLSEAVDKADFSLSKIISRVTSSGGILLLSAEAIGKLLNPNATSRSASGKIDYSAFDDAEAKRKSLTAKREHDDDEEYKRVTERIRARAATGVNLYLEETQAQKAALDQQQQQIEYAYAHQEITIEQFFAKSRELAGQDAEDRIKVLGKAGQALEAIVTDPVRFDPKERLAALQGLNVIAAQQQQARLTLSGKELQLTNQQRDAQRAFADELQESGIRLLELTDQQERATVERFKFDNRHRFDYIAAARSSGDEDVKRRADALSINLSTELAILKTRAAFNQESEKGERLLADRANQQSRVELEVRTGQITEIEGLQRISALNRNRAAELQVVLDKLRQMPEVASDPKLLAALDAFQLKVEEISASTDLLADKFRGIFKDQFADAIASFADGTKTFRESIRDLEKQLVSSLSRIAAQNVAEKLFAKGGPLGGVGDFFSKAFGGGDVASLSGAGSLLTAAGTGLQSAAAALSSAAASLVGSSVSASAGGGLGEFFGPLATDGFGFTGISTIGGFANGTRFAPGGLAIVGERGRELVNLPRGSQVIPNHDLGRYMGRGGQTFNTTINVPEGTSRASADQIARKNIVAIQRAMARN